jgi:hypothetical protein
VDEVLDEVLDEVPAMEMEMRCQPITEEPQDILHPFLK